MSTEEVVQTLASIMGRAQVAKEPGVAGEPKVAEEPVKAEAIEDILERAAQVDEETGVAISHAEAHKVVTRLGQKQEKHSAEVLGATPEMRQKMETGLVRPSSNVGDYQEILDRREAEKCLVLGPQTPKL